MAFSGYRKITDIEALRRSIDSTIARRRLMATIRDAIKQALQPYDGKVANARLASAVAKALGEPYRTSWDRMRDCVEVWGGDLKWGDRLGFNLRTSSAHRYDHALTCQVEYPLFDLKHEWLLAAQVVQSSLTLRVQEYNAAIDAVERAQKSFAPVDYLLGDAR